MKRARRQPDHAAQRLLGKFTVEEHLALKDLRVALGINIPEA